MNQQQPWDLIVIGGGTAGLVASETAAALGARVLLVERERLGGDCLWTGCVPSKALIASARAAHIADTDTTAGFPAALAAVKKAVRLIEPDDSREALEAKNVEVLRGDATFTSRTSLSVDGEKVRFVQAMIGTGAAPVTPTIPGGDDLTYLTSETVWDLDAPPERLLVLGGGPIACELGQAMARLGSRVTIIGSGPRLLAKEHPRASAIVRESLESDGVEVLTERSASEVSTSDGRSGILTLDDGTTVPFDRILAAIGRTPRTSDLGLDAAGVETDDDGYIIVTGTLRTSNPRIWAAGDTTRRPKFTHTAGIDGSIVAVNSILGLRRRVQTRAVPRVTFTNPEVAAVGLDAAAADPTKHRVYTQEHTHSDRAVAEDDTRGYTQIVVDRRGRVLGGTVVGPRAGETVAELTVAVASRLTTSDLAGAIHPYPTFSDSLWNAALDDYRHRSYTGRSGGIVRLLAKAQAARLRRG